MLVTSAVLIAMLVPVVSAEELVVTVRDQKGTPVRDAVVTIDTAAPAARAAQSTAVIDQKKEKFAALVTLLRPGDAAQFHNSDRVLHHVYSFSPVSPFDLLVRPGETTAQIAFAKAGVAAVGCNVHDDMLTYIYVSDAAFAALTGPDGKARIVGAPAGPVTLGVWHPAASAKGQMVFRDAVIAGEGAAVEATIALRPPRRQRSGY
jgi:plastocyanin